MRLASLLLAVAVLFASAVQGAPALRVVGSGVVGCEAAEIEAQPTPTSIVVAETATETDDGEATAPETSSEEEDSETDDSTDDVDTELLAVLPGALSFAVTRSHPQSWLRTHARPSDDPDPANNHRPPITA